MRTCLVCVLGHCGLGTGETFWREWASGEILDGEVRVLLNPVAMGMYCSVFLSIMLVQFNSV